MRMVKEARIPRPATTLKAKRRTISMTRNSTKSKKRKKNQAPTGPCYEPAATIAKLENAAAVTLL